VWIETAAGMTAGSSVEEVRVGLLAVVVLVADVDRDHEVEAQVGVQDHHVPRQHRLREVQDPEFWDQVPDRSGRPMSTVTKRRHITIAETASISPRTAIS